MIDFQTIHHITCGDMTLEGKHYSTVEMFYGDTSFLLMASCRYPSTDSRNFGVCVFGLAMILNELPLSSVVE